MQWFPSIWRWSVPCPGRGEGSGPGDIPGRECHWIQCRAKGGVILAEGRARCDRSHQMPLALLLTVTVLGGEPAPWSSWCTQARCDSRRGNLGASTASVWGTSRTMYPNRLLDNVELRDYVSLRYPSRRRRCAHSPSPFRASSPGSASFDLSASQRFPKPRPHLATSGGTSRQGSGTRGVETTPRRSKIAWLAAPVSGSPRRVRPRASSVSATS
jgi:hypothetical protein